MSTRNPPHEKTDDGEGRAAPDHVAVAQPPQPDPGLPPPKRRDPRPSASEALWLIITIINLTLLLWLIPEEKLQVSEVRLGLWVKILPVILTVFVAGYVWIKAQFARFVRRTSYKIIQTALLATLLTIHVSQLPIFPMYPKLDPHAALVGIDGETPRKLKKQRLFTTVKDQTVTVSSEDGQNKQDFDVSYKDVLFGLFYQPNWSLHNRVTVYTTQPGVKIRIEKTGDPFDAEFHGRPPATKRSPATSLSADPGDGRVMEYTGMREEGILEDEIRLPTGRYKLTFRRGNCHETYGEELSVESDLSTSVTAKLLCLDEQR